MQAPEQPKHDPELDFDRIRAIALGVRASFRVWPALAGLAFTEEANEPGKIKEWVEAITRLPALALLQAGRLVEKDFAAPSAYASAYASASASASAARAAAGHAGYNDENFIETSSGVPEKGSKSLGLAAPLEIIDKLLSRPLWGERDVPQSWERVIQRWEQFCEKYHCQGLAQLHRSHLESGFTLEELKNWIVGPVKPEPTKSREHSFGALFPAMVKMGQEDSVYLARLLYALVHRYPQAHPILVASEPGPWRDATRLLSIDPDDSSPKVQDQIGKLIEELRGEAGGMEPHPLWRSWLETVLLPQWESQLSNSDSAGEKAKG